MATADRQIPAQSAAPEPAEARGGLIHYIDLIVAAIILALCAWLYYLTTTFEEVADLFAQDIPPEFFPRLLLWFIMPLALLLPIEHRFFKNGRSRLDQGRIQPIRLITWQTIALLVLLAVLLPWLGAYLVLILACLLLPPLWGERRWYIVLPYALLFPTVVMFLFAQVLRVYFEPGIFGLDFR
jgi:putative tricarboxylic transport membrane protein